MGAGEKRFLVEVVPYGLPWWGVYEGYSDLETAKRVERRIRAKGWYKKTRVRDDDEYVPIDMIDGYGNPCGAVRAAR